MRWKHFIALAAALLPTAAATPLRPHAPTPPRHNGGPIVLVSIEQRYLWYMVGNAVVFEAPVAVGVEDPFVYNGKKFTFETPRGMHKVLRKKQNPIWVVPEWHYMEKAAQRDLKLVRLQPGQRYTLGDGSTIVVRDGQVGRINQFGNFAAFLPGMEIIFDDTIFMPPMGTAQREVEGVLGPYALDMGDGYMIHGTHEYNEDSIGTAASHGCVRMYNIDIERLYDLVAIGTPVYIN